MKSLFLLLASAAVATAAAAATSSTSRVSEPVIELSPFVVTATRSVDPVEALRTPEPQLRSELTPPKRIDPAPLFAGSSRGKLVHSRSVFVLRREFAPARRAGRSF